jgi:hypothetical protein
VTDVQLYSLAGDSRTREPSGDALLPELTSLPYLTAVNFHRVRVSAPAFEQFCVAVAPRLQVLLFESKRVFSEADPLAHIGLLHELRVLVVDQFPPASSLLKLHQLVYLHVNNQFTSYSQAHAVRRLSASHALRSLSFGGEVSTWVLDVLLATAPLNGGHTALVDWNQPIQLADVSYTTSSSVDVMQRCAAIPTLTRLQANVPWDNMPPLNVFVRLQQLRLQLDNERLLPRVAECNHLRVLQLSFHTRSGASAESLCAIVAANAATLEELRFGITDQRLLLQSALAAGASGEANWSALSQCVRLRVLELPVHFALTSHLLEALALAPVFQSLELALPGLPSKYTSQVALLPSALSSSSWCSVRLFFPSMADAYALRSTAGLAKLLPPSSADMDQPSSASALSRLRVFVKCASHSAERCFMLCRPNDDGSLQWQREY